MSSVIEGFLVRLGFDVDEESRAKFKGAVEEAGKRVHAFAARGMAIGTAFAAGALKATNSLAKLHDYARINRATIEGVNALGGAFKAVGGTTEEAMSAVSALSMNLKRFPNFGKILESRYGVRAFDLLGRQRDTVAILMDLRKELQKMPEPTARAHAEFLGLGEAFDHIMSPGFGEQFSRLAKQQAGWGRSLTTGAEASRKLQTEIYNLTDNLTNGLLVAVGKFNEETGLDRFLKRLNDGFPKAAKAVIDAEAQMMKESSGFFDWLDKWLFQADVYLAKAKDKLGTATDADRKVIADYEKQRRAIEISERVVLDGGREYDGADSAPVSVDSVPVLGRQSDSDEQHDREPFAGSVNVELQTPQPEKETRKPADGKPSAVPTAIKQQAPATGHAEMEPVVNVTPAFDPQIEQSVVVNPTPVSLSPVIELEAADAPSVVVNPTPVVANIETPYPDVSKWLQAGMPKPEKAEARQSDKKTDDRLPVLSAVLKQDDPLLIQQPNQIAMPADYAFSPRQASADAQIAIPEGDKNTTINTTINTTVNIKGDVSRDSAERLGRAAGQAASTGYLSVFDRYNYRESVRQTR